MTSSNTGVFVRGVSCALRFHSERPNNPREGDAYQDGNRTMVFTEEGEWHGHEQPMPDLDLQSVELVSNPIDENAMIQAAEDIPAGRLVRNTPHGLKIVTDKRMPDDTIGITDNNGNVIAYGRLDSMDINREMVQQPLHTIGSQEPREFARFKKGLAGTMMFKVYDRDALLEATSKKKTKRRSKPEAKDPTSVFGGLVH